MQYPVIPMIIRASATPFHLGALLTAKINAMPTASSAVSVTSGSIAAAQNFSHTNQLVVLISLSAWEEYIFPLGNSGYLPALQG